MRYECFSPSTPVFNIGMKNEIVKIFILIYILDEKGDKFYLILSGVVGVYIRKNKDDSALFQVKELFTGSGFGELALISNK